MLLNEILIITNGLCNFYFGNKMNHTCLSIPIDALPKPILADIIAKLGSESTKGIVFERTLWLSHTQTYKCILHKLRIDLWWLTFNFSFVTCESINQARQYEIVYKLGSLDHFTATRGMDLEIEDESFLSWCLEEGNPATRYILGMVYVFYDQFIGKYLLFSILLVLWWC